MLKQNVENTKESVVSSGRLSGSGGESDAFSSGPGLKQVTGFSLSLCFSPLLGLSFSVSQI